MEPTPTPTTARGLLMLSPRPMLRLTPLCSTEPMDMASPTPVSMVATEPMEPMEPTPVAMATTERGLLMLSLRLLPMLRLTPLCSTEPTDMASPTPVSTGAMVLTPMDTELMEPTPMPTTARGLLMLSPRPMPMPRLTPLCSTEPMDMASPTPVSTGAMVLTPTDTELMEPTPTPTTARGPLMLSPRLTLLCSTPPPTLCLP